jgi:predicted glutamine amidotransferase
MCLLTYFPADVQPDTDALAMGAAHNRDGHGFAIIAGERIIVRKSMDPESLIGEFESLRRKHPQHPALFHSRIGTGGTVNKFNCHPFRVGNDPRIVVAHNGIMPPIVQPLKGDPRCDTRIFAETFLPNRNLNSNKSRRKLRKWLGWDKVVVLSVRPEDSFSSLILNEQYGEWDGDIWYSNGSYRARRYAYTVADEWRCHNNRLGDHKHYSFAGQEVCAREAGVCIPLELPPASFTDEPYDLDEPPSPMSTTLYTRDLKPCVVCQAKGTVSAVTLVCTACLACNECLGTIEPSATDITTAACSCYIPTWMRPDTAQSLAETEEI